MGKRVTGRGFRKMSFKTLYQKINRRKKIENKEEINHKRQTKNSKKTGQRQVFEMK